MTRLFVAIGYGERDQKNLNLLVHRLCSMTKGFKLGHIHIILVKSGRCSWTASAALTNVLKQHFIQVHTVVAHCNTKLETGDMFTMALDTAVKLKRQYGSPQGPLLFGRADSFPTRPTWHVELLEAWHEAAAQKIDVVTYRDLYDSGRVGEVVLIEPSVAHRFKMLGFETPFHALMQNGAKIKTHKVVGDFSDAGVEAAWVAGVTDPSQLSSLAAKQGPPEGVKVFDIENSTLHGHRNFNPSICMHRGKLWMAYRCEICQPKYSTTIRMVELDPVTYQPQQLTDTAIELPAGAIPREHCIWEDPRLIVKDDKIYLFYAHSTFKVGGYTSAQAAVRLDDKLQVEKYYPLKYGRNVNIINTKGKPPQSEKNWTPFVYQGRMLILYKLNAFTVLELNVESGNVTQLHQALGVATLWAWGFMSGGTPAVPLGGTKFGTMFHSFQVVPKVARKYFGAWAEFDIATKRVTAVSRRPLMVAEKDSKDCRDPKQGWRPDVVFPCGLVDGGTKWIVSVGVQDCLCKIYTYDKKFIERGLENTSGGSSMGV